MNDFIITPGNLNHTSYHEPKNQERALGHTEFLVSLGGRSFKNIQQEITNLENASYVFMGRWNSKQMSEAGQASEMAMVCFDHIVGEFMRLRDQKKIDPNYANSLFSARLKVASSTMMSGATSADQQLVVSMPGSVKFPLGRTQEPIDLEKTLNKIKHRHPDYMNFRIQDGRHIFMFCPLKNNGSPDSLVELDVQVFCDNCKNLAATA